MRWDDIEGLSLQIQGDLGSFLVFEGSEGVATGENVTDETLGAPLAMWETEIQDIELEKGESGLGFSILDYQVGFLIWNYGNDYHRNDTLLLWVVPVFLLWEEVVT